MLVALLANDLQKGVLTSFHQRAIKNLSFSFSFLFRAQTSDHKWRIQHSGQSETRFLGVACFWMRSNLLPLNPQQQWICFGINGKATQRENTTFGKLAKFANYISKVEIRVEKTPKLDKFRNVLDTRKSSRGSRRLLQLEWFWRGQVETLPKRVGSLVSSRQWRNKGALWIMLRNSYNNNNDNNKCNNNNNRVSHCTVSVVCFFFFGEKLDGGGRGWGHAAPREAFISLVHSVSRTKTGRGSKHH